ncbi:MAG: Asp-tRNA(Asn)/Glu-tRNA(Gln) amidotransferase subunit GatC [Gammaproteobacteria bacterium]|nr:Asp-tRNA(Asn)/Glu-tRNA(Gln) amidotransferase subunit GatC [Gammaproteobacteria bacterium]
MSLDSDQVLKIAHLARLSISESETGQYASDLSNILDLVETMNTAQVDAITPMAHPLNMNQRLRLDKVTENDQRDQLMDNAPASADELFMVPKVIE